MSAPYKELEKPLDELAALCRGCLAGSGEMKNMFDWGLADTFTNITDIHLQPSSPSVLLCVSCEQQLISCQRFKEQCQNADHVITNAVEIKNGGNGNPRDSEDIQDIQENIVTPILYDKKVVFNIVAPDTVSKIYLPCMFCAEKYIKQKDLSAHLIKMHNGDYKKYIIETKYYCHVKTCPYFINSGTNCHFLGRKNLNQHFVKVHKTKVLQCSHCSRNFPTAAYFDRHMKICNQIFVCNICLQTYQSNERLMVHLLRKHPEEHKKYKDCKKLKRKSFTDTKMSLAKTQKSYENYLPPEILAQTEERSSNRKTDLNLEQNKSESQKTAFEKFTEFINDSPKRSSATQTKLEHNIRNDVTLPSWQTKTDEIIISTSTQTDIFDDLLSLKSQNSEDEIFFSESVSLSDIQTQTFPLEFGLSRSNKETLTSETQSPDLSIKETQTCVCLYDSPKLNFNRFFDSVSSSPSNLTSTETQTADFRSSLKSDVMLSFNSAETQTSFDESGQEKIL